MEKLEIKINNDIKVIPNELTLWMYQQIMLNPELYENNPLQVMSLFTGIPTNQIKDLKNEEIEVLDYLLTKRIRIPENQELILTFKHNGIEYGLENDWSKLTWGAWVDLEVFSADNLDENIHKIMAVLYRPVVSKKKKKYTIEKYKSDEIEDRAEIFKKLPLKYWFGAASFFFLLVSISINNTVNSLSLKNKLNRLMVMGWMKLPKWIKRKLPLDSILF